MPRLNISDRRERAVVAAADVALWPAGLARRAVRKPAITAPGRILCLRLERIGDLIMTMPALAELRALAPAAVINLVVGGWNREIAAAIPGVDRIEMLDAAWLTRDGGGRGPFSFVTAGWLWRRGRYDLAINFEPDIRSNL